MCLADPDRPREEQSASVEREVVLNHDLGFHFGCPFREFIIGGHVVLNRAVIVARRNARRLKQAAAIVRSPAAAATGAFARHNFHPGSETMRTVGAWLLARCRLVGEGGFLSF